MAFIIVMTGMQEGDYYALGREANVIGRLEDLPIHILDVRISRRHMKICFDEDKQEYVAIDMGSQNGVFINGKKINDSTALVDGDCITIGQTHLLFTLEDIADRDSALYFLRMGKLGIYCKASYVLLFYWSQYGNNSEKSVIFLYSDERSAVRHVPG